MNRFIAVTAIAVAAILSSTSTNAQGLSHIPSKISVENRLNEMNSLPDDEGTKPVRDLDYLYAKDYHSFSASCDSSFSTTSANHDDFVLPPSSISDAEIAAIDTMAKAYKWARTLKVASSKTPRSSIEALRSIHGNEKTVQEIAYGNFPKTIKITKRNAFASMLANIFAKREPTEKQTIVANGY